MTEARQLVEGFLDGHAVEWLSQEIEFRDMTRPGPMRGAAGGRRVPARLFFSEVFSDGRIDDVRLTAGGDRVWAEWNFRGRHTGSLMGEPPSDNHVSHPMACVYEVAGGEIRRASLYYDTAGLLAQVGIRTPNVPTTVVSVQEGLEALT